MTVTELHPVKQPVRIDGVRLTGCIVPYDPVGSIVADRGPDGTVIVFRERWDRNSIELTPNAVMPLLTSHDDSRPVGIVDRLAHTPRGLRLEATLVGSDGEVQGIARRARAGVMAGLSVGFLTSTRLDQWTAPTTPGGLPTVLRRAAVVREASIVVWPALEGAHIEQVDEPDLVNRSAVLIAEHLATRRQQDADDHDEAPPPTPIRPRPFGVDPTSGAPSLPPDPTPLERERHVVALRNWASDVLRLP